MAGDHGFQEYKTPGQAAEMIGVSVPTLRKYSLMIEKATSEAYFERNQQNARLYTQQNIDQLKQLVELSKNPDQTLSDVITQLYAMTTDGRPEGHTTADGTPKEAVLTKLPKQSQSQELAPVEQFMQVLTNMQDTVTQQKETIDNLQTQMRLIQQQNSAILDKLNRNGLNAPQQPAAPKSPVQDAGDTLKPSNITGSAPDDNDAAAKAAATPLEDLTEAEIAAAEDEAEAQSESAAKGYTKPRTLADMQLDEEPKVKRHWWQRLLGQ